MALEENMPLNRRPLNRVPYTSDEATSSSGDDIRIRRQRPQRSSVIQVLIAQWKRVLVILIPLLLSPIVIVGQTREARCLYVLLLMALFWMLELIDLAVTSLFPVVFFPLLGVITTTQASLQYLKDSNMLFLAGMMMACAMQHCHLHYRIALRILLSVGSGIIWLLGGFMLTSMFLSMWLSNTATVLLLLPICDAVVHEILESYNMTIPEGSRDSVDNTSDGMRLRQMMFLSLAYSASIGGIGTLIGTGPNIVFTGILDQFFPDITSVTFATWMILCVPPMIICTLFTWIFLYHFHIPKIFKKGDEDKEVLRNAIFKKYIDLGPMKYTERATLTLFCIIVVLWFFQDPKVLPGWISLFPYPPKMIKDATPGMAICILIFIIPSNPNLAVKSHGLMTWHQMERGIPWSVVFLLGGSFSLAYGCNESGLSKAIADSLKSLAALPVELVIVALSVATLLFTEVCSNVATTSIFLPICASLSHSLRIHPLRLAVPVTLASSFAYMLPVGTPPNAMVHSYTNMSTLLMIRVGFVVKVFCMVVCLIAAELFGPYVFHYESYVLKPINTTFVDI